MTTQATSTAGDTNAQNGTSGQPRAKASRKATSRPVATRAKRGGVGGTTPKKKAASKKVAARKPASRPTSGGRGEGKTSALDAAVIVLKKSKEPMRCHEMVEAMFAQKLWSSDGQTPHATLYSAILREIQKKGKESRFEKVERGRFQLRKA